MKTVIFTDGSSRGNPGPGGWGAIVVEGGIVTELGGHVSETTNNRMELQAVIEALSILGVSWMIAAGKKCVIACDSAYVVNGVTKWLDGWLHRGWQTSLKEPVLNRDLWERYVEVSRGKEVEWVHIKGHAGIPGNERCDKIATAYADGKAVSLFRGTLEQYGTKVMNEYGMPFVINAITEEGGVSKSTKKKSRRTGPAHSYLSMVKGVIETHSTWDECKDRVQGVSGAKFKKALSAQEQVEIVKEWKQDK